MSTFQPEDDNTEHDLRLRKTLADFADLLWTDRKMGIRWAEAVTESRLIERENSRKANATLGCERHNINVARLKARRNFTREDLKHEIEREEERIEMYANIEFEPEGRNE